MDFSKMVNIAFTKYQTKANKEETVRHLHVEIQHWKNRSNKYNMSKLNN